MLNKRILVLMFVVAFLLVGCLPTPTPPNEAPIITSTPITTATVGVLYTYNVNATDPDDDTLTYSLITKPTGMIINSVTGVIFWTPTSTQIGNNSVTVKVSDGSLSITQLFTIKVSKPTPTPINQKPVIYSFPIATATVGVTYVYDVNATDPDGDTLTYLLTTKPGGMYINPANGLIWWVPTSAQAGNNLVTVKAFDGALSDTQSFIIKVSEPSVPPVNQAPIIVSTPITVATVGIGYVYGVNAFDPEGDVLTYSLTTKPGGMAISPSTGKITWTPGSTGSYAVTAKVSDGVLSDSQSFTIVVSKLPAVNHAPVITPIPSLTAILGITFTYDVEATDPDNDVLTYSLTVKPSGMVIGPSTGKITWIPNATGSYDVAVKVSDGELSDSQPFTVTVVTVEITGIEVKPDDMTLFVGVSETIESVTAIYEIKKGLEATIALKDCTYESSKPSIAEVSDVGVITGVAEGGATITVTYAGKSDTIVVTVSQHPSPVHNIDTDEYYDTIQAAIYAGETDDGDTIKVAAGTYTGAISIEKQLILLGANAGVNPVIDTRGDESIIDAAGITISADSVTVDGFTVTGAPEHAIQVNVYGQQTLLSSGNTIANNILSDNGDRGVFIWKSENNTIANNVISYSDREGIYVWHLGNNIIENNVISYSDLSGIYVSEWPDNNIIRNNTISYSGEDSTMDFVGGISLNQASGSTITGNTLSNQRIGIALRDSVDNMLTDNTISDNDYGIYLRTPALAGVLVTLIPKHTTTT